jgi:hypothetical protein
LLSCARCRRGKAPASPASTHQAHVSSNTHPLHTSRRCLCVAHQHTCCLTDSHRHCSLYATQSRIHCAHCTVTMTTHLLQGFCSRLTQHPYWPRTYLDSQHAATGHGAAVA